MKSQTIVEITAGNPDFSTLVTAVQAAGLVDALSGPGPFTAFAPNNAAFATLPAGTLDALLVDTNRLRHILLYHLVQGPPLRSSDLGDGSVLTMHGAPAQVDVSESGVTINTASVITADIEALNGIIHVLDRVILPADAFTGRSASLIVKNGEATVVWPEYLGQVANVEVTQDLFNPDWQRVAATPTISDGVGKITLPADPFKSAYPVGLRALRFGRLGDTASCQQRGQDQEQWKVQWNSSGVHSEIEAEWTQNPTTKWGSFGPDFGRPAGLPALTLRVREPPGG